MDKLVKILIAVIIISLVVILLLTIKLIPEQQTVSTPVEVKQTEQNTTRQLIENITSSTGITGLFNAWFIWIPLIIMALFFLLRFLYNDF